MEVIGSVSLMLSRQLKLLEAVAPVKLVSWEFSLKL